MQLMLTSRANYTIGIRRLLTKLLLIPHHGWQKEHFLGISQGALGVGKFAETKHWQIGRKY